MSRPYIICHMVTSLDDKVTGDFLSSEECERACDVYYEVNRKYKSQGSGGFICGRVTMEESFTHGWYPDLSKYNPVSRENGRFADFWGDIQSGYYAIAFDPRGKLGWKSPYIEDCDPGYDRAEVIEVLTNAVDGRYLAYLCEIGIPYVIAGDDTIDVELALSKIGEHLAPKFYLLEGGSIVNGHFLCADCVDELSLVRAPVVADTDSKPLFMGGDISRFRLVRREELDGAILLNYKKQANSDLQDLCDG